jgi:A/G-specific adenine glycosylase
MLVRTRAPSGLLGGMTEVPTTAWAHDFDPTQALDDAPRFSSARAAKIRWRQLAGVVTHTFTHFPLELTVYTAQVPAKAPAPYGARWVPLADLAGEALPNVMRKVIAHALDDRNENHVQHAGRIP